MKLIIRQYLASLKERGELDAILPDLLSSMGFTVYSRPGVGTTQYGVDIAAVGKDDDGERKIFLLTVKQGDLTRQEWDGPFPQALRPSLNQILDAYITTKIPKRYRDLKIVICICLGGDVQEQVRPVFDGFIQQHTTDRVSFDEWNGDRIAGLIMSGILREEILPREHRSSFQKAVAMVDEPDIAYSHFARLVQQLSAGVDDKSRVMKARQLYVCLWVLFVWARDADNVEAPYRASELALLAVWNLTRPLIGSKKKALSLLTVALNQLIQLHLSIAFELLDRKIFPRVGISHAISMSVRSHNPVDVNLKLFDLLGRIATSGLWLHWLSTRGEEAAPTLRKRISELAENGFKLIWNNPSLFSPLCDEQAIDIALFLLLMAASGEGEGHAVSWLREMVGRMRYAIRMHGRYPTVSRDYRDLINHPREKSDVYRREATSGSTLIPLLGAWLSALSDVTSLKILSELKSNELKHCTLQLWLPDEASEDQIYIGGHEHGIALCDLPLSGSGKELLAAIAEGCTMHAAFDELSANRTDYWPLILIACRHYRFPVPPQFWISSLHSSEEAT